MMVNRTTPAVRLGYVRPAAAGAVAAGASAPAASPPAGRWFPAPGARHPAPLPARASRWRGRAFTPSFGWWPCTGPRGHARRPVSTFVPRNTIETIFASDEIILSTVGLNWPRLGGRQRSGGCCMAVPRVTIDSRFKHAGMRAMPRQAGTRCPFPQFVERTLVDSHSLLLEPLRSALRARAIRRQRPSLAHLPRSAQQARLTVCPTLPRRWHHGRSSGIAGVH